MVDNIRQIEAEDDQDIPYDAGDPKAVNIARIKAGRRKTNKLRVVRALMDNAETRMWLYDLLAFCHIGANPFVAGDPYATHIKIGEMNIGNRILSDINDAAPDQYMTMVNEGRKAYKSSGPTN